MLKLDKEKIKSGVVLQCKQYPNEDGTIPWIRVSILSDANRRYQQRMEALTRPFRRQLQLGTYGEEKAEGLQRKAFVETSLFEWGNFQENGKEIPFSQENAMIFFGDDTNYAMYQWMIEEVKIFEHFADEAKKIEAKN